MSILQFYHTPGAIDLPVTTRHLQEKCRRRTGATGSRLVHGGDFGHREPWNGSPAPLLLLVNRGTGAFLSVGGGLRDRDGASLAIGGNGNFRRHNNLAVLLAGDF